ncbi:MAG: hypothetical protein KGL39_34980 [Patescibacteria group bacterium]|nr:hypothetical protein [Patescibacteria group bacterium]
MFTQSQMEAHGRKCAEAGAAWAFNKVNEAQARLGMQVWHVTSCSTDAARIAAQVKLPEGEGGELAEAVKKWAELRHRLHNDLDLLVLNIESVDRRRKVQLEFAMASEQLMQAALAPAAAEDGGKP